MIPTIETIIEELLKGDITKQKAITWLNQHAADAHADLRDHFAGLAMQGYIFPEMLMQSFSEEECQLVIDNAANFSYRMADAMMAARNV